MADFFKKIGKGISDTSKNVKESVENSRRKSDLRQRITAANNKIEQIKITMGEKLYNAYVNDTDAEDCTELCRRIDELRASAEKCKADILAIDGIKKCDNCGLEINADAAFCSHCGAKQLKNIENNDENNDHNSDGNDNNGNERSYVDVGN